MSCLPIKGLRPFLGINEGNWAALLEKVGLPVDAMDDDDALLPLVQGLQIFEAAAEQAGRPWLGAEYAQAFPLGGTGALGFALVNAKTVRDALKTLIRFIPLISSLRYSAYREDDDEGAIVWQYAAPPSVPRIQFLAWGTAVVIARLRPAMPAGWMPTAVQFDTPKPVSWGDVEPYFGANVEFDCPVNKFSVLAEHLGREMPGASPALFALMTKLASIEQHGRGAAASVFEAELKLHLADLIKLGQPRLEDLAAVCQRCPGSLRTEMKLHNLDFKALLNEVRKQTALAYLRETDLSITEITFSLGYSDCSIFTRACRKWFGKSPSEVRRTAA